jgi:thymidylate synthase (FAD)
VIKVIPGGWIKVKGVLGNDLSIVNDARQSFDVEHSELTKKDEGLINFLMKHKHGTPFEGVTFKFQIHAPLPVVREAMRHRNSSFNEVSGRYIKMKEEFYYPAPEAIRTQKGKPGAYTFEPVNNRNLETIVDNIFQKSYNDSYKQYEELLKLGIAKELARNVLCQGLFTTFMYQANARSLMNFLSLRNAPNSMYEIRRYAEEIEKVFAEKIPITYKSFIANGRVAP